MISTQAATCCDHFPDAHRVWPWEQTGLQYVAADGKDVAAAVPVYEPAYPAARHLVWPPKIRYKACPVPWCLSHVPGACCVVDHHCAGRRDKFALAATRVGIKSSTRLQCERHSTDCAVLFGRASRTRREQSIRPKISQIDFDLTELEISEVWPRRPSSLVDFHTGSCSRRRSGRRSSPTSAPTRIWTRRSRRRF